MHFHFIIFAILSGRRRYNTSSHRLPSPSKSETEPLKTPGTKTEFISKANRRSPPYRRPAITGRLSIKATGGTRMLDLFSGCLYYATQAMFSSLKSRTNLNENRTTYASPPPVHHSAAPPGPRRGDGTRQRRPNTVPPGERPQI